MDQSRLVLVGAVLVLAGCLAIAVPQAGMIDDRFSDAGQPDDGTVAPPGGNLTDDVPVTPDHTFDRLTELLSVSADRPPVVVRTLDDDHRYEPSGFYRLMGLADRPDADLNVTAFYEDGTVTIDPGTASPAVVEQVLAHEFAHALQEQGVLAGARATDAMAGASTTDEQVALRGAVEGEAVWVTHQYAERFVPNATSTGAIRSVAWRRGPPAAARVAAPYHFGNRYVAAQVDDPTALTGADPTPPTTSEQLLHNETPGTEPPADLSVSIDEGPHAVTNRDVQGELATRVVLRAGVGRDTARRAAAGWSADRLRELRIDGAGETYGYAWAHRWDTSDDATEFRAAMERFVDNRTASDPGHVRVVQTSDRTTVVLAGPSEFVTAANATGTADAVEVSFRRAN